MNGKKTLILTEKPSVAKLIGNALGVIGSTKQGYFSNEHYVITWCVGHLVEPAPPSSYGTQYEKWTYESLPIIPKEWQYDIKQSTRGQFEVVKELIQSEECESICLATDPGREGEAIGRMVCEKAGCRKPMKRLWISSLEEHAIVEGMKSLKPSEVYDDLYAAALCRQRADWLIGINGTRLFTVLYGGKTLKVGRVQSPTLAMLAEREEAIRVFRKEPYYVAHLSAEGFTGLDAVSEHFKERAGAEKTAESCRNGIATVMKITKETKTEKPPLLYDMTSLQRDANRLLGYTAKQTLEYAQSLYEQKLLTYPRTDSHYLSEDMEETAAQVLEAIFQSGIYEEEPFENYHIERLMDNSKVSDHHAILPTVEIRKKKLAELAEPERRLLDLVAIRVLAAASESMIYETVKAEISCSGYTFHASGRMILCEGFSCYMEYFRRKYALKKDEKEDLPLPKLKEGQKLQPTIIRVTEHFTSPPKRYTEATLLHDMERAGASETNDDAERKGLGTPATRADIIEKLIVDGYVRREKKALVPTEDGMNLIRILPEVVKSPKMTAEWENALTCIAKGELEPIQFMGEIEELVERLVDSYRTALEEEKALFARKKDILGNCPNCGLEMVKGRYGIYCKGKCGMTINGFMGKAFTDEQVSDLLAGSRILMKGLSSSQGRFYNAYLIPDGVEKYSYRRDGKEFSGYQMKFRMEFPDNSGRGRKRKESKQA